MTKIRPAVCLNLESAYHPSQAKIKILGVIVFVISIAHVRQSAYAKRSQVFNSNPEKLLQYLVFQRPMIIEACVLSFSNPKVIMKSVKHTIASQPKKRL